jgi:hypothetical protein
MVVIIASAAKQSPFKQQPDCHCEERSDEATSAIACHCEERSDEATSASLIIISLFRHFAISPFFFNLQATIGFSRVIYLTSKHDCPNPEPEQSSATSFQTA